MNRVCRFWLMASFNPPRNCAVESSSDRFALVMIPPSACARRTIGREARGTERQQAKRQCGEAGASSNTKAHCASSIAHETANCRKELRHGADALNIAAHKMRDTGVPQPHDLIPLGGNEAFRDAQDAALSTKPVCRAATVTSRNEMTTARTTSSTPKIPSSSASRPR